jgi:hypothetical protein
MPIFTVILPTIALVVSGIVSIYHLGKANGIASVTISQQDANRGLAREAEPILLPGRPKVPQLSGDVSATENEKQEIPNEQSVGNIHYFRKEANDSTSAKEPVSKELPATLEKVVVPDKPKPVPSAITWFEYNALSSNKQLAPLEKGKRIESFSNKIVTWIAFVDKIQPQPDSTDPNIAIYFRSSAHWDGGMWCHFLQSREPVIEKLQNMQPVRISGVLKDGYLSEPTIEPIQSSTVSMKDYLGMLAGSTPQVQVLKQHVGKYVTWKGVIDSIQNYPDNEWQYYRIDLIPADVPRITDYVYCSLSAEAEPAIAELAKGTRVQLEGILTGRTEVMLTYLNVDLTPPAVAPLR